MMYCHTKCGYRRFSSWGDIIQMNIHCNFEPFCDFDLDHNRAIQSFHKTIQFMMMCHQSKFHCKRISSLNEVLKSITLITRSFIVALTWKIANQSFRKTLSIVIMHHHTNFGRKKKKKFPRFKRDCLDKHSLAFSKFAMILTLNTVFFFSQDTLAYDDVSSDHVGLPDLVGALSPVNPKGLYQGWKQTSTYVPVIQFISHQTTKVCSC